MATTGSPAARPGPTYPRDAPVYLFDRAPGKSPHRRIGRLSKGYNVFPDVSSRFGATLPVARREAPLREVRRTSKVRRTSVGELGDEGGETEEEQQAVEGHHVAWPNSRRTRSAAGRSCRR